MGNEQIVKCPVCGANITLEEELEEGDIVNCSVCDSELELTEIDPPKLAQMKFDDIIDDFDDEDDWEDDLWDEEEDYDEEEDF